MTHLLNQLKRNRAFRIALTGLKLLTLFLFGICLVSFISAATQIFTIGDVYIEAIMLWSLRLLLGSIALLFCVVVVSMTYAYFRSIIIQRRKRTKLDQS
ncbi:MAG: hypothetical protein WBA10_01585 [Elainellaceae cyanobacterium]